MANSGARRLTLAAAASVVVILVVALAVRDDADDASLPVRADATYADGSSDSTFKDAGQLVATAAITLEGRVLRVEEGAALESTDGSGGRVIPRIIVVETRRVFHTRAGSEGVGEVVKVVDGYWEDGKGYERESVGWAARGETVFLLLSRDRGPDGERLDTFTPLSASGIAIVRSGLVEYAEDGVWADVGDASRDEFAAEVERAAEAARSGAATPVPITLCFPSVPGDENSEPICETE